MHAAACLCYQDVFTDMPQIGMHGSPERCRSRLERAHAERVSAPESQSFTPLREPPDRTLYRCRPPEAAGAATYGQTYDDLLCLLHDPARAQPAGVPAVASDVHRPVCAWLVTAVALIPV